MDDRQLSVLKTLSYSDVFDHPLSLYEIHYFLHTKNNISLSELKNILVAMRGRIVEQDGYFAFFDKKFTISRRLLSDQILKRKITLARKTGRVVMKIPSVLFVGISGGVAGGSVAEEDDIDLFVITRKGSLYMTRFLLLLFLQLMGKRRRRNQVAVKDTICLNMLIDESSLMFTRDRHDLYTAREIAQIIPLFERNSIYGSFLNENRWTREFLPNATGKSGCHSLPQSLFPVGILCTLEPLFRTIQGIFIRRHSTREVVDKSFLAFHPNDMKDHILTKYYKTSRHYIKYYNV